MINSHRNSGGVHLRKFEILPGEVFIVLRPRTSHHQRQIILQKIIEYVRIKTGFSDMKLIEPVQ
jgi:hypothetical protein